MSHVRRLLEQRTSVNHFDTTRDVGIAEVTELVRLATLSPSAYHFQNWQFVAVRDRAARQRLMQAAYGQPKVLDAPVTIVVCGTLNAHRELARRLQPSVDGGVIGADVAAAWVSMAASSHEGNAALQRDEAFRSAGLAAMTLMLAAQDAGYVTGPMSGFDPAAVAQVVGLGPDVVPVMLVTLGHPAAGNWRQKPRRPVAEVLRWA